MIKFEEMSKKNIKETMQKIEAKFINQSTFNAMDDEEKVEMIKDYMYLQGVDILGKDKHDVRLYGGIKTNNLMESVAYSLVQNVKDGGEVLKELRDPLWHKLSFPSYDTVVETEDMRNLGKVNVNEYIKGLEDGRVTEMRESRQQRIADKRAYDEHVKQQQEKYKQESAEREERERIEKEIRDKKAHEEQLKRDQEDFEKWKIEQAKREEEREKEQKAFEEKMRKLDEEYEKNRREWEENERKEKAREEQQAKERAEKEANDKLLKSQEEQKKPVEENKPKVESEFEKNARLKKEAKDKEFQAEKDQAAKDVNKYGDKIASGDMGKDDFEKRQTIYKYLTALCKTDDRFTMDKKSQLESSIRNSMPLLDEMNTLLNVKKGKDLLDELTTNKFILGECKKSTMLNTVERKQVLGYQDFAKDLFGRAFMQAGTVTKNVNDANQAKVGVHLGSKEYDKAVASINTLKDTYNDYLNGNYSLDKADKKDLLKKIQAAESDIEKYYQRKVNRKELTEDGEFTKKTDAKSKKRIDAMKASMETLSKIRAELGLPEHEVSYKKNVTISKTSINEMMEKTGQARSTVAVNVSRTSTTKSKDVTFSINK